MRHLISAKDYAIFAGGAWPSYQDFVNGATSTDPVIAQEMQDFLQKMDQYHQEITKHGDSLSVANQQRQRQIFFDKRYPHAPHCNIPWNTLGIQPNGDVFICHSPSWIPKFVGNVLDTDDIFEILNSDTARSIRREILAGRYTYCNNRICSFFRYVSPDQYQSSGAPATPLPEDHDPDCTITSLPSDWILDFDFTCNLKCPSCRTEVINTNKHLVIRPINDRIAHYIKHNIIDRVQDQKINIRWCGGEPFISEPYLDILGYIVKTNKANIQSVIQTNGSYLKTKSDLVLGLLPFISALRISFDAATADTYHAVRINGQWNRLIDNTKWILQQIKDRGAATQVSADFVVQKANYLEIPQFVALCKDLGIQHINWTKMWNWGTWPMEIFDDMNVYDKNHAAYPDVIELLRQNGQPYNQI